MDILSPLDAEFVEAEDEDPKVSMAIGSIAVFEGPEPPFEEFTAAIAGRLPLIPRYRQKLRTVPLRLGRPVWVDDPDFDVAYHIRRAALPRPGGDGELFELMAYLMSQRLDRDHPLWEDHLVSGLADGRWALISKVHHCMVDGVSGTDLYRVFFDTSRTPAGPAEHQPVRHPSATEMTVRSTADAVLGPGRALVAAAGGMVRPTRTIGSLRRTTRATVKLLRDAWPADRSSLTGPIGHQRRYTSVSVPLADVKSVKRFFGGTVNDVVLAAITYGLRSLLLARDEEPTARMVPSLVPVSLRALDEGGIYENRVSGLIVHLPVHLADPADQLSCLRSALGERKEATESAALQSLFVSAAFVPYPIASLSRIVFRVPQREIVTVTTNVPGPRTPLYCLGRELVEIRPYVPIASTVRISTAIFSYCDRVTFGITGDYDSTPDLAVFASGIEEGMAKLVEQATERTPS